MSDFLAMTRAFDDFYTAAPECPLRYTIDCQGLEVRLPFDFDDLPPNKGLVVSFAFNKLMNTLRLLGFDAYAGVGKHSIREVL